MGEKKAVSDLKQWLQANRAELLNSGIATIVATYSGEGDSGRLDYSEFLNKQGDSIDADCPEDLYALLEALHDEMAPAGYEINEGGGGEFRVDVETGVIAHESYYLTVERSYNTVEEYC